MKLRHEWGTADSRPKCNKRKLQKKQRYQDECGGKDGKQRTFPTFPPHGCGYLFHFFKKLCCTWNLNPPTHCVGGSGEKQR
jgi:hypothetical protein